MKKQAIAPLVRAYFPDGGWRIVEKQGGGMNNTTRFVETRGGRFVLRIYETHRDEEKVRYEHAILSALGETALPFRIPMPVRTPAGDSMIRTPDGKLAAMFRYLEGEPPSLEDGGQLRGFGSAVAALSAALSRVKTDLPPAYRPYYELDQVHPQCGLEAAAAFCSNPPEAFSSAQLATALSVVGMRLEAFRRAAQRLPALPHQLIHGDLNASNALADSAGNIAAILDFEFVTRDLRAMEVAVCLSDMIRPNRDAAGMWSRIEAFVAGYRSAASLTDEEIEAMPQLLMLRRLDVFIHFLGRYRDGVDGSAVVSDQIMGAYAMSEWLDEHERTLLDIFRNR